LPDYRYKAPMATLDPKKKVERSRNLAAGYSLSNVLQSEEAVSRTIEMLLDWMDKYAEGQKPMDLDKFFTFTAFDVVGEILFSKQFGFLQQGVDIGNAISNSLALNAYAAIGGFLQPLNMMVANPFVTWLQIMPMGHLFNTTLQAINERQKNDDARFDMVAHWFKTLAQHPERMKLRDIYAQATTSVGAGADTVSCALQSFVYHMIRHPTAWQRVRDEIDAARKEGFCTDRVVLFDHAQKLPYLQACIKEAMRVFGPVPMGLPRVAPREGIRIGDRSFPAGTILSINPWVMHHSKEIWGPDAQEFNPDRWFKESAAATEKYWIPVSVTSTFSSGQRRKELTVASPSL
jgi:cytochrome P450